MSDTNPSFLDRHYFLLRRLHSLAGVFPIGVFLVFHLTTNSSIVWGDLLNDPQHGHAGVETFQHEVNFIHNLPALILMEIFVLFVPIAFHALLGIWFALTGHANVAAYGYGDNWRYTLQRLSGYLGVVFIFMHITSLRFGWNYWGLMPAFDPEYAASSTAVHFQQGAWGWFIPVFYLVCVLALVFHLANGLWTAALTWGLTISEEAQKRWGYVCAVIGLGLGLAAILAVYGFSVIDVEGAREVERNMLAVGGH
ncbi:MAG: succinate dehydrogenase [Planctomycetota bacterium]|nr:succinate dehydrogenase [Planctomycetota bacterium]